MPALKVAMLFVMVGLILIGAAIVFRDCISQRRRDALVWSGMSSGLTGMALTMPWWSLGTILFCIGGLICALSGIAGAWDLVASSTKNRSLRASAQLFGNYIMTVGLAALPISSDSVRLIFAILAAISLILSIYKFIAFLEHYSQPAP